MKKNIAISKNKIPIRLNKERWFHITEEHSEIAGYYYEVLDTIENPQSIYEGNQGAKIAVSEIESEKYIAVIYKEVNKKDGFIITSFLTRKKNQLERRKKIWPRKRKK